MHQMMFDVNVITGKIRIDDDNATRLGYEASQNVYTVDAWFERSHPQERDALINAYTACQRGDSPEFTIKHRQCMVTEDWAWVLSIGKVVAWDEEKRPAQILGTQTLLGDQLLPSRQTEVSFDQNNKLIYEALDAINDGLVVLSSSGRILYFNKRFLEIWSLPTGNFLGKDRSYLVELTHDQVKNTPQFAKKVDEIYESNKPSEDIIEFKDGRIIERRTYPLFEQDKHAGRIWLFRDVTETRKNIHALREHQSQLSVIFNKSNDLLALVQVEPDKTLRLARFNEQYMKSLAAYGTKIDPQDIMGKELIEYLRDDIGLNAHQQEYTLQNYYQVIETGQPVAYEDVLDMPDGRAYTEVTLKPIFDPPGVCRYILYSSRDVTSQHENNKALRLTSFAVENVSDAVCWMDQESIIVNVNEAACTMLGYTRSELIGMSMVEMSKPLKRVGVATLWKSLTDRKTIRVETELITKSGVPLPIEVTANHIVFDDQQLNCSIIRDITERKQAEEASRQAQEELERQVDKRTAQLKAANAELESFAYSVSHDLRAPLRAIDGFSQALLEDYDELLDDIGKNYLSRVRAASQNMAQLIDDLLNLSRITRQEMTFEDVKLSEQVRDIAAELKEQEPHRSVTFEIAQDIVARGDRRLLYIALVNLLHNAWKFTSKRDHAIIKFEVSGNGPSAIYSISDNGAGFDIEYVNKLFNAFQRLHSQDNFKGTGIGLATVKRIIERHGGHAWAEAEVDRGATFYFTLSKDAKAHEAHQNEEDITG